jgi:phosphoribosylformylglycinamidine synthase
VVTIHHLHPKLEATLKSYRVPVQIVPRPGILDPQGAAVAGALRTLGFESVTDVRVGRFVTVDVSADSAAAATEAVQGMCSRLLANPVIEDFALEAPEELQSVRA